MLWAETISSKASNELSLHGLQGTGSTGLQFHWQVGLSPVPACFLFILTLYSPVI